MIWMCSSVYRDRRGRFTNNAQSVMAAGLKRTCKKINYTACFSRDRFAPQLRLFIREDTRFREINNGALVKGICNDEPKLYHFLNSCIIDESKKSLWYHFQRRFRSMTQKTIWIVWKGMWVAVNLCTAWSLCMANRIKLVTNSDESFFFFFFSPSTPVMWTWVSQVTQRAALRLPLYPLISHPEIFIIWVRRGYGCAAGIWSTCGGKKGLCWNRQTARCLYPETQIHKVYDPLHLQSEK